MERFRGVSGVMILVVGCAVGSSCGGDSEEEDGGTGGVVDAGGASGAGGATEPACVAGSIRCPCYPNDTCNDGLTCVSAVCVDLGSGGSGGVIPIDGGVGGGPVGGGSGSGGQAGAAGAAGAEPGPGGAGGSAGTVGCGPTDCEIGGVCYSNGAQNPGNECEACDWAVSAADWVNRAGSCSGGTGLCVSRACDTRCSTWADCELVEERWMFRVPSAAGVNGNTVCQAEGLTCASVPVLTVPSAACLAFHPGALVTQSTSGWEQGVWCDTTSQELACANTEKCHDCPACTPGIDCSITNSSLLAEYYVECVP